VLVLGSSLVRSEYEHDQEPEYEHEYDQEPEYEYEYEYD